MDEQISAMITKNGDIKKDMRSFSERVLGQGTVLKNIDNQLKDVEKLV